MLGPYSQIVTVRPTIDTAIYAANDIIGGLIPLSPSTQNTGQVVEFDSLTIIDESNQKAALNILLFGANPADSTTADQGALTLHANDRTKLQAYISVLASDYGTVITGMAIASLGDMGIHVKSTASNIFYVLILAVGTPTYTGADDLILHFGFEGT